MYFQTLFEAMSQRHLLHARATIVLSSIASTPLTVMLAAGANLERPKALDCSFIRFVRASFLDGCLINGAQKYIRSDLHWQALSQGFVSQLRC